MTVRNYRMRPAPANYNYGAPYLFHPDAPHPDDHAPSPEQLFAVIAKKSAAREIAIQQIMDKAKKNKKPIERFVAAIMHDTENAPFSTNAKQLEEIGIHIPSADLIDSWSNGCPEINDAAITGKLWQVIYGLASLGIFLTGTDYADDRALLKYLIRLPLADEIRDLPASPDMNEFIDLFKLAAEAPKDEHGEPIKVCNRDELLPVPDQVRNPLPGKGTVTVMGNSTVNA
mgnify:CR=1 FL=1